MGKSLALLFFYFLSVTSTVFGQKQAYEVFIFGKKIGDLKIDRITGTPQKEIINMFTDINAKVLLVNKWSKTLVNATFENNILTYCNFNSETESARQNVKSVYDRIKYNVQRGAEKTILNCAPITCSTVHLFYHEPVKVTHVFSERYAQMIPLQQLKPSEYSFKVPDGAVNIYKYRNGVLHEIELKKTIGTAYVRPAQR